MSINRLCGIVAASALVLLSGCSLQVKPIKTYTSPDGLFSLQYPMEWEAQTNSGETGIIGVGLGSQVALNSRKGVMGPSMNESAVVVMVVPLLDSETGTPLKMPIYNAISLLIIGFNRGYTQDGEQPLRFDDPFRIWMSPGREVHCSTARTPDGAVTIEAFKPVDDVIVSAFLFGPPDEHAARTVQLEEIVRSMRFNGTPLETFVWSKVYALQAH